MFGNIIHKNDTFQRIKEAGLPDGVFWQAAAQ
jgi:hypothetical protein